jgi:opacity protein-like surface antigen
MFLKRTLAASMLVVASAAAAGAADLPTIPVAPAPPPPPVAMAPSFDWSGPYVGAYGGAVFNSPTYYQAGIQAGYNFTRGNFLAGIEGQAGADFSGGTAFEADVNARVGGILGERVLLYAEAGVGLITGTPTYIWTAGGGMEVAVGNAASVFAEAKAVGAFTGGCCALLVQGGLNWHFGR